MRAHTAGGADDGPMTTTVPASVLVVEDEKDLAAMLGSYLQRAGFAVELAHTGPAALELARQINPGVIVLDLGLPGLDGFEVCRRLRTFTDCYVLMLTARTDEIDTVVGLSVGADDYITKPFSPRELVARIGAVLRRPRTPAGPPESDGGGRRVFGALLVDLAGRRVLITAGGHDPICPPALTERLAGDLRAARADVMLEWHEGGHEVRPNEIEAARLFLAADGRENKQ